MLPLNWLSAAIAGLLLCAAAPIGRGPSAGPLARDAGEVQGPQTVHKVNSILEEYEFLRRSHLNFVRQTSVRVQHGYVDTIITVDPMTRATRDIAFLAPATAEGAANGHAVDLIIRAVMASGDGKAPETAFVIGGRISAEYQILRFLGLRPRGQALMQIRGCRFDVLDATEPGSERISKVYFKLGRDALDPQGPCTLDPRRQ